MKSVLTWESGMAFMSETDGNSYLIDAKAPIGHSKGMTPKELISVGLAGCTAMDTIAWLRKHKQPVDSLVVETDIEMPKGQHPTVFTKADIYFKAQGNIDPQILNEAVRLSQTKYCGVSAMLVKAFPIQYIVLLNGQEISRGQTQF